jgi:hypothetical protein
MATATTPVPATAMATGAMPRGASEVHRRENPSHVDGTKDPINATAEAASMVVEVQDVGVTSMAGVTEDRVEAMGISGHIMCHPGTQWESQDLCINMSRDMAHHRTPSSRNRGHLQQLGVRTLVRTWKPVT